MIRLKMKLEKVLDDKRMNANELSELTKIRYATIRDMKLNISKAWKIENLEKIMEVLELNDISELIEYKKD